MACLKRTFGQAMGLPLEEWKHFKDQFRIEGDI
jgi:hypothetical protein